MSQKTKTIRLKPKLRRTKSVPTSMDVSVKTQSGFQTIKQVRRDGPAPAPLADMRLTGGPRVWSQAAVPKPAPVLVIHNLPPDHPLCGIDATKPTDLAGNPARIDASPQP